MNSSARVWNSPGSRRSGGCRSSGCASSMAGGEGDDHSVPVGAERPPVGWRHRPARPTMHPIAACAAARIDVPQRIPRPGSAGLRRWRRPPRRDPALPVAATTRTPARGRRQRPGRNAALCCRSAHRRGRGAGKTPGWRPGRLPGLAPARSDPSAREAGGSSTEQNTKRCERGATDLMNGKAPNEGYRRAAAAWCRRRALAVRV